MVGETNLENAFQKSCSRCDQIKTCDKFINRRNICRECANTRKKEQNAAAKQNPIECDNTCNTCIQTKNVSLFMFRRNICKDCHNENRRNRYKTDEQHRLRVIQEHSTYKHNKVLKRRQTILETIGENNKKCSCCDAIKPKDNFRHNRLKCRTCERDDPKERFKRNVRSRIYIALKQNKTMRTIKYLGCCSYEYLSWILHNDENFTLENQGKEWHIDHVIPLSRFNLDDDAEQLIAFNWRNTMPLSVKENLSKNKKIVPEQIERHYQHLLDYHKEKKIEMPQQFIDLFAKHLVAGIPLEPSLPLSSGNTGEELG
jgi:hypothetical protein